ncbi:uncharacterized protein LOC130893087 [Diorhabda carinulata]|uniref:uncharacterized protein LOC130893087 n=1 Tax=Diorhabda carinulata TaxID=1163345 RepID=UPI0025A2DC1A|nr:uncharacterized protein LOC130893087 [Diorhabda carinulata]
MEIQPNQNEAFEIYLPECLLGSQHYVSLLIQNTSRFDTEISLKRKKMCSCVMKQSQVKINITKLVYDCPHRDLLLLENTNDTVKVNSTEMFTIKVTYNIPGETIMAYEIHLKHNRVFFLYFHIFGILPNTGRISAYNPHYTMLFKPVNLATRNPPTQVFWLYNNSELPMEIEVNEEKLNAFCKKENYKIFECITQNGEVKPFSIFGLNFKFCPIELKKYKMNLPILLNGIETVLILEGFGTSKWPLEKEHLHISMPQSSQSKNKFPVVFSADYIIFECLPIWNHTEKIIFIENITKNKVIYYEWSSVNIPKYVKITAGEETGYLLPSQSHAVTVKVESFYESLLADFILTCQLTDLQQLFTMKKIEQLQKRYDTENENVLEFSTKKQKEKVATIKKEKCAEENSIQTFNDPVMYIMALTVRVNIVHRKDVNFTEIIKYYPIDVSCCTRRNVNVFQETWINNELQINITEHVLNRIISDVVFSRAFKGVVKAMKEKTHMNYIQFEKNEKLATSNSEKKLETFFSRPPLTVLSETLKTFIEDSFFDTFNISTAHKEGENGEQNEGRDKESVINSIIEHLAEICRDECTCKVEK